jgi:hypothetical protein
LAIGAVVLQFVLPAGDGGASSADLDAIRADITQLKQAGPSQSLKIAYMDAEQVFTVFVLAVGDLRQRITDKTNEITALGQENSQGLISEADFQREFYVLNAELLDARATVAAGTLDRMIASDDFSDLRSSLITLREQAGPLLDKINELVSTISVGAIDATEFNTRHTVLSNAFEQFDGYVTSAATQKLVQATDKVARAQGYDLVIRKKDVIMYRNDLTVDDITETVKAEIAGYL